VRLLIERQGDMTFENLLCRLGARPLPPTNSVWPPFAIVAHSKWAGALREGLDPDIARFIQDQAAARRLLATSTGNESLCAG
jgi:hypothetical protein